VSSYPVPGEWFDDSLSYNRMYSRDDVDFYADEKPDSRRGGTVQEIQEIWEIAQELADKEDWRNAHRLRALARRLEFTHREMTEVALEALRPRPAQPVGEPSATGNCRQCGAPLPMPTMRRGAPRKLCLTCSPPRHRGR
jgi:hypothetical protein